MIDLFDAFIADMRGRLAWYRGPEIILATFFLGSAFFVLLVAGIEHSIRGRGR